MCIIFEAILKVNTQLYIKLFERKILMANRIEEIQRRRIFGIISHPDAGKTTLTEKLLLHGGAIREAGTVKARRNSKFATSDWMEIEKQRGISVTRLSPSWIHQVTTTSVKILIES